MSDNRTNEVRREEIGRRQRMAIEMAKIKRECIIEECARAVEEWEYAPEPLSYRDLIDRLRALKDKP